MSADQEVNDLRERYRRRTTEDLLRVVHASQDYRPDAVRIAQEILATRDLSRTSALTEAVVADLRDEGAAKQRQAEEPLGVGVKIFCFVFCGVPGIVFAGYQGIMGRTRRAREAWAVIGYGWLVRIAVFLLFYLF